MKRILILFIVVLAVISITACNDNSNIPDELENPLPEETIMPDLDLSPVYNIIEYNPDELMSIPYEKSLPDHVEVIVNNENATVYLFQSTVEEGKFYVDKVIDIKQGVRNGKILYKKITSGDGENWDYGYMNSDFSLLNNDIYIYAKPFEDGNAIVQTKEGFGVIDTDGNYVLPCSFTYMPELIKNIIKVPYMLEINTKYYDCYNRISGDFMYRFKSITNSDTGIIEYYKLIDDTEIEMLDISEISETTLIPYKDYNSRKYGYKNGFGEITIAPKYLIAYEFSDGLARVKEEDKYGFINSNGEYEIEPIYDSATSFKNTIATVSIDDEDFVINTSGDIIDSYDFKVYKGFHDDISAVVLPGSSYWQYVDIYGDLLFSYSYSYAGNFSHGLAPVKSANEIEEYSVAQYYYIDKTGNPAFGPLVFLEATELNEEGYALAFNYGNYEGYAAFNYYIIESKVP